jgi:hypothetical protein
MMQQVRNGKCGSIGLRIVPRYFDASAAADDEFHAATPQFFNDFRGVRAAARASYCRSTTI